MEKLRRLDPKVRPLILLLWKLRFKTAKPGLTIHFAGTNIFKPGAYSQVVKNLGGDAA